MMFIEASAATSEGVRMAFEEVAQKIIETPGLWEAEESYNAGRTNIDQPTQAANGGLCCWLFLQKVQVFNWVMV